MGNKNNEKVYPTFTIRDNILIGNPSPTLDPMSISESIFETLSKNPDFAGQINTHTEEVTSFAEMKDRSIRCALWLRKQNIGKDDIVCISTPHQTDDYVPILATFYVGAICNTWYHDLGPDITRCYLDMVPPKVVFACEKSIDRLAKVAKEMNIECKFVVFGTHSEYPSLRNLLAEQDPQKVGTFHPVKLEDPENQVGLILFSSGTSGFPKSIMVSYDSVTVLRSSTSYLTNSHVALTDNTLHWSVGIYFLISCILHRITRIIYSRWDPQETTNIIKKYKVQWTTIGSEILAKLLIANVINQNDYASLKYIRVCGSRCKQRLVDEIRRILPHTRITNYYGMTEVGALTEQHKDHTNVYSIGHVVKDVKMKVIDPDTGCTLGPNQEGELCFKVNFRILGYYKDPVKTDKLIDNEGWLHTGDQGYFDGDGQIFLTDRIDRFVLLDKDRISLAKIEDDLMQHSGVDDVAVVPVPHQVIVERLIAFVVKLPGSKVTAEELKVITANLKEYSITVDVIFIEKLPRTSTAKINFKELKEMAKIYAKKILV